ncbi:hypothetical protein Q5H92_08525 [Hymenobacter sp. M29]|uniref:Uncharacterized protein n=1 Tax=Hymenobacter mellowenesis TaxID=3063995 RepID=A0ABT9A992_9BACT|nr:hypothetical protein [Hymenobacter sp. M29]MDO7846398.1 hypothetical protein [Hymenobacter sp. M29]
MKKVGGKIKSGTNDCGFRPDRAGIVTEKAAGNPPLLACAQAMQKARTKRQYNNRPNPGNEGDSWSFPVLSADGRFGKRIRKIDRRRS